MWTFRIKIKGKILKEKHMRINIITFLGKATTKRIMKIKGKTKLVQSMKKFTSEISKP